MHLATYPASHDGFVFSSRDGGPIRSSNFRHRHWTRAVEASAGHPCRFHDLRHSNVAMLIAAGPSGKVSAQRLGHTSVGTLLDVDGHLFDGLDQAAADALDGLVADRRVGFWWG